MPNNTGQSPETFVEKITKFNANLRFDQPLPAGIGIMNPFKENQCATPASEAFYNKYYNDFNKRRMILGINPGRFGAGLTGVPFTDPKRLLEFCDIKIPGCPTAHEPSSEFVYAVINACGGPEIFYQKWYINSICPLGFTRPGKQGKPINYNYYDNAALQTAALPFIKKTLPEQINFGIITDTCICLGTGKNAAFLNKLNEQEKYFKDIISIEHPRYIMQYKRGQLDDFIKKYVYVLQEVESME